MYHCNSYFTLLVWHEHFCSHEEIFLQWGPRQSPLIGYLSIYTTVIIHYLSSTHKWFCNSTLSYIMRDFTWFYPSSDNITHYLTDNNIIYNMLIFVISLYCFQNFMYAVKWPNIYLIWLKNLYWGCQNSHIDFVW